MPGNEIVLESDLLDEAERLLTELKAIEQWKIACATKKESVNRHEIDKDKPQRRRRRRLGRTPLWRRARFLCLRPNRLYESKPLPEHRRHRTSMTDGAGSAGLGLGFTACTPFRSEVPNNADADKKIALVTIASLYIQLRHSRPEVPNFPA